jgi:hypothetical protein
MTASTNRNMAKRRTITLTQRRPVTIIESEWPVIAEASDNSWTGHDPEGRREALSKGELNEYTLHVRQHADGRHLIYGTFTPRRPLGGGSPAPIKRAGYLLDAGKAALLEVHIQLTGNDLDLPGQIIADCINSLPPTEL